MHLHSLRLSRLPCLSDQHVMSQVAGCDRIALLPLVSSSRAAARGGEAARDADGITAATAAGRTGNALNAAAAPASATGVGGLTGNSAGIMLTVMRSTSLKTQKSPPTSPGQKKIVRFADTLGLDLAAVRTIMQEDLPLIPLSAFDHLDLPKELLSDIRDHVNRAASANGGGLHRSASPSPTSSPSSRHRIFNGNCQVSGGKPLISKYSAPFLRSTTDRCFVNDLADLHLDLDDDLLDDCLDVKPLPPPPVKAKPANATAAASAVLPSILNKKTPTTMQSEQELLTGALPPWLSLYRNGNNATLVPEFIEPFVQMNFLERVKTASVCLENCYISNNVSGAAAALAAAASSAAITTPAAGVGAAVSVAGAGTPTTNGGTADNVISVTTCVRVVNRSFEKQIYCRFTTNEWSTWCEEKGSFIPSSSDSWSDRFTATFYVGHLNPGQRVKFALRYVTEGKEYWDNNNGQNYSLVCRI